MADNFRVIFAGLADNVDIKTACANLAAKLKTSDEKVALFFKGKPLFAPSDKDKALKQTKLLASLGIKSKLQAVSNAIQNSSPAVQITTNVMNVFLMHLITSLAA